MNERVLQDRAQIARARSRVYALFSTIYHKEPNKEFLSQLNQPDLREALSECGLGLPKMDPNDPKLLQDLEVEYTRLFCVPSEERVSPLESVQSSSGEGTLMGEEALDIKKWIRECGLELTREDVFPDHVATELEIMQKLSTKEGELWSGGEEKKAKEVREAEKLFLEKHLARWFPQFSAKIEVSARQPLYSQLTGLANQFIKMDKEELQGFISPD